MPPPRILLVMPEHWPRALLRAELIERGYDVVGTPDLPAALLPRPVEKDRGPVRVIVIDQDVLVEPQSRLLDLLVSRHPNARLVLLSRAQLEMPPGAWDQIVRRPALIGEIASSIEQALSAAGDQPPSPRD
jgi:hypothetical protein